jgi:hypothetical protein
MLCARHPRRARCSCSSCSRRACALLLGVEQDAALGILAGRAVLAAAVPGRACVLLDIEQDAALGILAGALFLQQLFPARMRTTSRRRGGCCARHPRRRAVLAAAAPPGAHAHYY